jgi:hypothetical protein
MIANESADATFREKLTPYVGEVSLLLPPPRYSAEERRRRRLAFRNERKLYHRKCDATQESIISCFSPDKPYKVYSKKYWGSDAFDPFKYGKKFDFSKTFFEQFNQLLLDIPHRALVSSLDADDNNCRYINFAGDSRNCYMIFNSDYNVDSLYSSVLKYSKDCIDCLHVQKSELCYECVDCINCYNVSYSQDCSGCRDSYFLYQCIGCSHCAFSSNLVHKEYYIFNKHYTPEQYHKVLAKLNLSSRCSVEEHRERFDKYCEDFYRKHAHILNCEECVGDYLTRCNNCFESFGCTDCQDVRHCDSLFAAKDCMDVSSLGEKLERAYESQTVGIRSYDLFFCSSCVVDCFNLFYSFECRRSNNCFGSACLKQGSYVILNHRYSRSEYEDLVPRIVAHMRETGEWGEFFPMHISPFGYNETIAQSHYPLKKGEALNSGAKWSDYESNIVQSATIANKNIPDAVQGVTTNTYVGKVIKCPESGKLFKYQKQELAFYETQGIPLPVLHPEHRHERRMSRRNPMKLRLINCASSREEIYTCFSVKFDKKIVSEHIYNASFMV